jgi:hypothetical protein
MRPEGQGLAVISHVRLPWATNPSGFSEYHPKDRQPQRPDRYHQTYRTVMPSLIAAITYFTDDEYDADLHGRVTVVAPTAGRSTNRGPDNRRTSRLG